ncbi:hypothetical protein [Microvirga lenta]|uniref:hypothetical protein n=1 Tax=Microvirga lenta TaxID=2881337 RepID=UPI001CFF88A7|nr:hypothetical protein [Microvirga lenta]MCB5175231.1 hypothetical protein [Microvirga lenta]
MAEKIRIERFGVFPRVRRSVFGVSAGLGPPSPPSDEPMLCRHEQAGANAPRETAAGKARG